MGKKNSLIKKILTTIQGVIIKETLSFTIKSVLFFIIKSFGASLVALFVYHWKFAPKIQERSVITFEGVKNADYIDQIITNEIKNCKTDGIFVGFVGQYKGELKFLNLDGNWNFDLTPVQQEILHNPLTIGIYLPTEMKANATHILNVCNSLMQTMAVGSTKDTNPIYSAVYTEGNSSVDSPICTIDDNTKAFFKNAQHNKLINISEINQSGFFNCIVKNLNLPKYYNTGLSKIYIYPFKIKQYDIAFLSLSFVNNDNGDCFSQDGKNQEAFARRIAGKLQQGLN